MTLTIKAKEVLLKKRTFGINLVTAKLLITDKYPDGFVIRASLIMETSNLTGRRIKSNKSVVKIPPINL